MAQRGVWLASSATSWQFKTTNTFISLTTAGPKPPPVTRNHTGSDALPLLHCYNFIHGKKPKIFFIMEGQASENGEKCSSQSPTS